VINVNIEQAFQPSSHRNMISVGSQVLEESKQKVECGSRRQFDDNWVASWRRHSISV